MSIVRAGIVAALVSFVVSSLAMVVPSGVAGAAPPGDDEVVAFEVRGVGNGHGRGLSQWGTYGRAVDGQSWQQILGAYYGGTVPGTRSVPNLRVRLTPWDGAATVGVISTSGTARWNASPVDYSSLYAVETAANTFSVYGNTGARACPGGAEIVVPFVDLSYGSSGSNVVLMQQFLNQFGFDAGAADGQFGPLTLAAVQRFQVDAGLADDGAWRIQEANAAQAMVDAQSGGGWQQVATGVAGPIRFSTPVNQSSASASSVLGVCRSSGSVTHYRGVVEFASTSFGNRVVNELDVENYLRGVLPKEVPAGWGDAAGGKGMHALRAQSVAARSYGLSQGRYSYASTCDTSSCQVYGGAASRSAATSNSTASVEHVNTDQAIRDTAGVVRQWPSSGAVVSTEFSASNGPRTAGGLYPSVDDPWDDASGNPNHRWTRVIDADTIRNRYGLASANGVRTQRDADSPYEGIWANEVVLGNGSTVSAWDFRNAFGLKAPGFELVPIHRTVTGAVDLTFIGDSVGASMAVGSTSELQVITEGAFADERFDAVSGRRTQGGSGSDGVEVARTVAIGTDIVVVELGYNDDPAAMPGRIDAVMSALRARSVGLVLWVNMSERRTTPYEIANAALRSAADRWEELAVLDWNAASGHGVADRWYSDGVHLTSTGQAEFALWLRERVLDIVADGYTPPRPVVPGKPLRVPVMGLGGIPADGAGVDVVGVALNVTAVGPVGPGFLRVWPCGSPMPETSSVNYVAGGVEPNAVVVPVDETGEVCVASHVTSDVIVDVSGWFDAGVRAGVGRLVDTREGSSRVDAGDVLRVPVTGRAGVPVDGVAGVALNVTAVGPVGPGFLRVWPCGSPMPETSSVNYVAGGVEPNAVVVPVDETGEVCVASHVTSDVIVDLTAWFDDGLRSSPGDRVADTRYGIDPAAPR